MRYMIAIMSAVGISGREDMGSRLFTRVAKLVGVR